MNLHCAMHCYRVSFEKFAEGVGFKSKRSVADGIDEVIALVRSGLIDDPYAPRFRN